jgi:glycosyltransferase involved in cell wall biosynthesis
MDQSKNATLYLCYFGVREPLVQTQVIPYLQEILKDNIKVSLLSFEPNLQDWTAVEIDETRRSLAEKGIVWHYLKYHKTPTVPATLYDVYAGFRFILRLMKREKIDVLHARSYIPAMMGGLVKRFKKVKLIFDIRGFLPEEYVDSDIWTKTSLPFRGLKRTEKWLLRVSDGFVMLTQNAQRILFPNCVDTDEKGRPFEVIPCCVNFSRFKQLENLSREQAKIDLGLAGKNIFVYVGSLGGFYLTEEMADFMAVAHAESSNAFLLILTQSLPEMIIPLLKSRGIPEKDFLVKRVKSDELPRYLRASDVALSFIKPTFSKRSSSPTKIAEYLAGGVPIVFNSGVGDLDEMLGGEKVGAIVHNFTLEEYRKALQEIEILAQDADLQTRCEKIAEKYFALEQVGGVKYRILYKRLLENNL